MEIYSANDVLTVEQVAQGRAGVGFLNWNIRAQPLHQRPLTAPTDYAGTGLYGLCFDDQLIYIGSYLGNDRRLANFGGDVVSDRWWTHIGAITARSHRLHIAKRSLRALDQELGNQHVMTKGFQSADLALLTKDAGNLGPLRRLQFAASRHQIFLAANVDPASILKRFTFVYERVGCMPIGMDGHKLMECVTTAETWLIASLAPACNTTHVPRGKQAVPVACLQVGKMLRQALVDQKIR